MASTPKPLHPDEVQLTVRMTPDGIRTAFSELAKLQQTLRTKKGKGRRAIEAVIEELGSQASQEVWAELPDDFNEQLDHYIYGVPKR